ncbi:lipocalin-like domain-containing protein [Thiocystis violacea]|uniref:lipocalin-like domain-containing protein n=1 Tax=Thiocystis violacea TaxID=13725 RepID=UPI001907E29A|nr:lipocalin family protein [Thiocystis violacea]MBK1718608.1 hypothetical protein [Thiocystis violacea]
MKIWIRAIVAIGVPVLVGILWLRVLEAPERVENPSLESLIGEVGTGFAPLDDDWRLNPPQDHGAHPETRGELWNLALWLEDTSGARHWIQFNLARLALSPAPVERASGWATNHLYRGQLVRLSDGDRTTRAQERLSRAALGLAGASVEPPRVWLEDWSFESAADPDRLMVKVRGGETQLDLILTQDKPALAGDRLQLFARERGDPGVHAYLLSRLSVTGTLGVDGRILPVRGSAWLDHAWGGIGADQGRLGLNRFAVQLDDGRDLICLEIRRQDGSGRPIPSCALIHADGAIQSFQRRDLALEATRSWTSPRTGRTYRLDWRLAIPLLDLELALRPLVEDQETDRSARLWSGAIRASGRQGERPISGVGRVELAIAPDQP